jgi:hypothetical protein
MPSKSVLFYGSAFSAGYREALYAFLHKYERQGIDGGGV